VLAASMRQVQNISRKAKERYGAQPNQDWQLAVEGCLGEMALAKHLGVYWRGKGETWLPDVGKVDVRTTPYPNGKLIVHDGDDPDRRYYLLTGLNGTYIVRGYMRGQEAINPKYWSDPTGKNRHAYFVPQKNLVSEG